MTSPAPDVVRDLAPTGTLRASINLGNPVLAQGTSDDPSGITVDLATEVGLRLGVPVGLVCFDAARKSFEALINGSADLGFLAVEPARAEQVAFTAPYVVIEGVFVVPEDSPIQAVSDVDQTGVRIGVKEGSAYDLYLTRTLQHATLVRGSEGVEVFTAQGLESGAGIRQPVTSYVESHPETRLIEEKFMEIQQAVATTRKRQPRTLDYLRGVVEELKADGFVAEALRRSGQTSAAVAPPA